MLIGSMILGLSIAYYLETDKVDKALSKADKWEETAKEYSEIPEYNKRAEEFVTLMNKGEGGHKEYLTGEALKRYEAAISDPENQIMDAYIIDSSLIKINILITQTELDNNNNFHSRVMYELDMTTVADDPDNGIIDKRIVTNIVEIDWNNEKVNHFEITWFNDTLGTNFFGGEE